MLNERYRSSPTAEAFLASWQRINGKISGKSFANVARGLQEFNSTDRLKDVHVPCLVIAGEFDRLFPPSVCEKVATLITGARFSIIPGAGHLSSLDSPKQFNELLLQFLRDLPQ
jgi:pimeloyl-ACP methyl ester carboxylesterase